MAHFSANRTALLPWSLEADVCRLKIYPADRNRFGWRLNSVEFSFDEDGVAAGFRATGRRARNLRFHRVEEWSGGGKISERTGG